MGFDQSSFMEPERSRMSSKTPNIIHINQIFRHIWAQILSNNDIVYYCYFLLDFLLNFSLLLMVYYSSICVNTGLSHNFWVIILVILMYTYFYILISVHVFDHHLTLRFHNPFGYSIGMRFSITIQVVDSRSRHSEGDY